jgi:hypothetical protein
VWLAGAAGGVMPVKPPKRGRNPWWVLIVILIAGAMLGSVLANAIGQFTYLSWLGRSVVVGLSPPVVIDLGVMTVTAGFTLRLNLAIVLGILIAAYVFRML